MCLVGDTCFLLDFIWLISQFSKSSKIADWPNLLDKTKSATDTFKKTGNSEEDHGTKR